jgi:hypothetical protein
MLRIVGLTVVFALAEASCFGQGTTNSGVVGRLLGAGSSKPIESQYFQAIMPSMQVTSTRDRDDDKKWFEVNIDKLRSLRVVAKSGKISGKLQPVRWTLTSATTPKGEEKITVVFRDADQKGAELARIDACLERLKVDLALLKTGEASVLKSLDLKSSHGVLNSAMLLQEIDDRSQVWEVNQSPIFVSDFRPDEDGELVATPTEKKGVWYRFHKGSGARGIFARSGEKEVEIKGVKTTIPAFRFIAPEGVPAEEKLSKKKFLTLSAGKYGLEVPE